MEPPELMEEDSNESFVLLIVGKLSLGSTCSFGSIQSSLQVIQCFPGTTAPNILEATSTVASDVSVPRSEAGVPLISGVCSALIGPERASFDSLIRINARHIS